MTLEEQTAALRPAEIVALLVSQQELRQQNAELQRQVEWFKRQLFGRKSERRLREPDAQQLPLAGLLPAQRDPADAPPPPTETVKAYQRRARFASLADTPTDSELRFDSSVPVEVITLPNPEVAGLSTDDYEVIGEKITYRVAQRPGAYVILKYVRHVVKLKESQALVCPPAPPAVLEKSLADVSVLAELLLDKFRYHLPLYRQHQRLRHAGIRLSRGTLTQWVQRTAALLEPIYYALLSSILQSAVLTMDETPIKAGRHIKGKLHTGYFWPLYGDQDEIAFPFAASRAGAVVREALGSFCGILLTDGYIVYEHFAQTVNRLVHAQCWSHARRKFVDAERAEPTLVARALDYIEALYAHEARIRQQGNVSDLLMLRGKAIIVD
jgi:transposase